MSLTVKIVLWLVLGTFALTAHAHELSEGTGIVCDTPDQVQRFAVLGAKPEAIKTINDGAAKAVCALTRSEEHTSELQSLTNLVCRLLLEKKKTTSQKNRGQ